MIEVVRACITADHIAKDIDFMSFGTNDLTQGTFSFSREDAENKFLPFYEENKIISNNPFEVLDRRGVGQLINIAVTLGKKVNKKLEIGICGEHGGDPNSIYFFNEAKLNYVSCSPYRIPVARLTAALSHLK